MLRFIVISCLTLLGFSQISMAQETGCASAFELWVEVQRDFSPFESVSYQLRNADGVPTLIYTRRYYGNFASEETLALLQPKSAACLREALRQCGLCEIPVAARKNKRLEEKMPPERSLHQVQLITDTYQVNLQKDAPDPLNKSDAMILCLVSTMRHAVNIELEVLPLRMVFIAEDERGFVNLHSTPSAHAVIDGVPQPNATPILNVPLPKGQHVVRFINEDEKLNRSYGFRVDVGVTTIIDHDLNRH